MNARPLTTSGSRLRASGRGDDDGFTIIEVVMSIALVTIVMTSLAAFFVNSAGATDTQSQKQTAVQVATDAMEKARSLTGIGVLSQRDKTTSDALWTQGQNSTASTSFPDVAPYLANIAEAWDQSTGLATNSGYNAPLPTDGNTVSLDNVTFTQNWFLGYCYASQSATAGACRPTVATGLSTYVQVVVDVTWHKKGCRNGLCSFVSASLISPTPDPLFDANQSAPKPKIRNPGNQVNDAPTAVNLALTLTGGTAPVTWSVTGLPTGLTLHPGTSTTIDGTLATAVATPAKVLVKVTDAFGFVSTAAFTWTVNAKPNLTNPAAQITTRNTAVTLNSTIAGGSAPLAYTATGLPTGLSINATTGVITGTPTVVSQRTVTVTATDAVGQSDAETFAWSVVVAPTVNVATSVITAESAAPSAPVAYTCDNGPCSIRLTGSVPGIGLKSSIDGNSDNTSATTLVVATGSGTVYLNGKVQSTAVSGTATTSTNAYNLALTITDDDAATGTDTSAWTARTTPTVTWPGDVTVARNATVAQPFTLTCASTCTISVTGAPAGVGLATASRTSTNSTTSISTASTGTYYLTGKVTGTATTGNGTVTLTVTNTVSTTSYTLSSVGVWTVT